MAIGTDEIFVDYFERDNSTESLGENYTVISRFSNGGIYGEVGAKFGVFDNQAYLSGGDYGYHIAYIDPLRFASPDYEVHFGVPTSATGKGIIVRASSISGPDRVKVFDGYVFQFSGSYGFISRFNEGLETELAGGYCPFLESDPYRYYYRAAVETVGSAVELTFEYTAAGDVWTPFLTFSDSSDQRILAPGTAGLFTKGYFDSPNSLGRSWDDFVVLGSSPAQDITPPSFLTGPDPVSITSNGFSVRASSSESGYASLIVVPSGFTTQPPDAVFDSSLEKIPIIGTTLFSIPHLGEAPGANLRVWLQLSDYSGNRTTSSVLVTTSIGISRVGTSDIISAVENSVSYLGGGFGSVVGTGKIELSDGGKTATQSVVDWSDKLIHCDTVQGPLKYSDASSTITAKVTTNSGLTAARAVTLLPPASKKFVTLGGQLYLGPGSILSSSNFTGIPAQGDQVEFPVTYGFSVLKNGEIVCDVNSGVFDCRYNDGSGWSNFTVILGASSTPDPFSFANQTGVLRSAVITSEPIKITGISDDVPVSVSGGEYSIDDSPFVSSPGSVSSGKEIRLRHISSASFSTSVSTTITVGGFSASFRSTTLSLDLTPDPFSFTPVIGASLSTVYVSNAVTITGINSNALVTVSSGSGGAYSIDGGPFTNALGIVRDGSILVVRVTSSDTVGTTVGATITITGVTATFSVTTASPTTVRASGNFWDVVNGGNIAIANTAYDWVLMSGFCTGVLGSGQTSTNAAGFFITPPVTGTRGPGWMAVKKSTDPNYATIFPVTLT